MSPRGRPRQNREPKRKAVKIRLCERLHAGKIVEPYRIMEEIIATDRQDLADLKIGIAWHAGWRPDADGLTTHGKCQRRSDLDRSLDSYDVIVILNEKSWLAFRPEDKLRLISHELEHIQLASDKNGEPLIDDKGRLVVRMKRHDVADFASIIKRFGLPPCLTDVQIADADRPLLAAIEEKQKEIAQDANHPAPPEPASKQNIPDSIELKFKGLRNCKGLITLVRRGNEWRAPWSLRVGNLENHESVEEVTGWSFKSGALQSARAEMIDWLERIEPTGTADAKRSMKARLVTVRQQINEQIEKLDPLEHDAEGVEFEEDPEAGQEEAEEKADEL